MVKEGKVESINGKDIEIKADSICVHGDNPKALEFVRNIRETLITEGVEFGNIISPEINKKIRAFKIAVEKSGIDGIVETVPTYRSLLVHYRPEVIGFKALTEKFEA